MQIFVELLVLLILARALGAVAERLGQPASLGEIISGVILAAAAAWFGSNVPFLVELTTSSVLEAVANVGIFVLVLLAGIEMEPREIAESTKISFAVAFGGMIVPLAGGFGLAWFFLPDTDLRSMQALLTGIAVSITAIPATVKLLEDLGQLHSRIGQTIISAAVFDDVLGLFLLAVLLTLMETGHTPDAATLALLLFKVGFFFTVTVLLGVHVYPRVSRGVKATQMAAMEFSALAIVALAYGLLAELLGMHWILGPFMAGLYFEKTRVGVRAYEDIKLICVTISKGGLGPLFLVYIGLRVDLTSITAVPLFLSLLIAVAFIGKLAGAGLPALWVGLSRMEAAAVGIGMSARGAVELVVLSIAYEAGVFVQGDNQDNIVTHLFSSLILMGVVTTLLAPMLLRQVLTRSGIDTGPD